MRFYLPEKRCEKKEMTLCRIREIDGVGFCGRGVGVACAGATAVAVAAGAAVIRAVAAALGANTVGV